MSPDMLAGGAGAGAGAGPPGGAVGQTPPGLPSANPALMLAQMMRRSGKKGKKPKHGRGKRK